MLLRWTSDKKHALILFNGAILRNKLKSEDGFRVKNNKTSPKVIFFIAVIAIIGFLITMGNYLWVFGVTFVMIVGVVIWQWPNILTLKGQAAYADGNNTKALSLLKRAHELPNSRVSNSTTYAYILLRLGQAQEAANVLNYVLLNQKLKKEEKLQARQILSLVRYRQGDFAEATRLMEMVFEGYKNSSVYGALGYYKILSKAPDAEEFNREAYEYNPDDKVIIDNAVIIAINNGDYKKAKELSEKSINANNKGVEIFYHAGQAYLGLGDKQKALEHFKKAQSCTRSFMTTVSEQEIMDAISALESEKN